MNTKGIKFLAVLAVLAMAFAAFAVIAPAEENDAAHEDTGVLTPVPAGAAVAGSYYFANTSENSTLDIDVTEGTFNVFMYYDKSAANKALTIDTVAASAAVVINVYIAEAPIDNTGHSTYTAATFTLKLSGHVAAQTIDLQCNGEKVTITALKNTEVIIKTNSIGTIDVDAKVANNSTSYASQVSWYLRTTDVDITMTIADETALMKVASGDMANDKATLTVIGGKAITDAALDADIGLNAFAKVARNTAVNEYYQAVGYNGSDATYAYGTVSGIVEQAAPAAFTLVDVSTPEKGALSVKNGNNEYKVKLESADGSMNTGATQGKVTIQATAVEFVKGNFMADGKGAIITKDGGHSKVTVNEGVSVEVLEGSTIEVLNAFGNVTITAGTVDLLQVGPNSKVVTTTNPAAATDMPNGKNALGTILDGDLSINSSDMEASLTIPEGKYLEIKENLFIKSGLILTVKGELRIGSNATINAEDDTAMIILEESGKIVNNGLIGKNFPVCIGVSSDGAAFDNSVQILGLKGVEFTYQKVGTNAFLSVSGTLSKVDTNVDDSKPTLAVDGVTLGTTDVMTGIQITDLGAGAIINKDAVLMTESGSTLAAAITVPYGAAVALYGFTTNAMAINAQTFIKQTTKQISDGTADVKLTTFTAPIATNTNVTGFEISVDRVQYAITADSVTTVYYDQRAYISGDLELVKTNEEAYNTAALNIAGTAALAYVAAGDEISISNYDAVELKLTSGTIVVLGEVSNIKEHTTTDFIGVKYSVKIDKVTTTYVNDFEIGLAALLVSDEVTVYGADADADKVTAFGYGVGQYTLTSNLVLGDKESIVSGGDAAITVPAAYAIIVEKGGALDASVITALNGKVVAIDGSTVTKMTTEIYQVVSTSADGTKTYAGLEVILSEAQAGDEILFPGDNALNKLTVLTVKEGVTLKVTGTLYAAKIIVEKDGVVTMTSSGSIILAKVDTTEPAIDVAGKLDTTGGTFTFTATDNKKSSVKSVGELIFIGEDKTVFNNATITGVVYVKDAKNILSTIENAIEDKGESLTIDGKYESTEAIELDGTALTINGDAKIATLNIKDSTVTITNTGKFTGSIVGVMGTEDSFTDVEVKVTEYKGIITNNYVINAEGKNEYSLETGSNATTKNIEIVAGTLVMKNDIKAAAVGDKSTFKLGSAATLKVAADKEIGVYKTVAFDGTLVIAAEKTLTINSEVAFNGTTAVSGTVVVSDTYNATVSGTFEVKKDATATFNEKVVFLGDVVNAGTLTVNEDSVFGSASALGAAPSMTGKITLGNNTFIVNYGVLTKDNLKNADGVTVFEINGTEYFDVYFKGAALVREALALADFSKITGLVLTNITTATSWTNVATGAKLADVDAALDDELVLNFVAGVTKVVIKTSWATGTSMYIDGVRVVNENYELEVGTHTVKVTVNPGYKGTNMVTTYKGATVTDKFTVATADAGAVLSLTGDITVDPGVSPEPTPAEKEAFGITEILLVVLVILIAVMVIIVLLRMNRS